MMRQALRVAPGRESKRIGALQGFMARSRRFAATTYDLGKADRKVKRKIR